MRQSSALLELNIIKRPSLCTGQAGAEDGRPFSKKRDDTSLGFAA